MDNKKDDIYYLKQTSEHIDAIIAYVGHKDYGDFMSDIILIDAVMFRFVQMVENINHISPVFKDDHPEVKWSQISGFRNRIVHEYGKTDYSIVYEVVSKDVIKLKKLCEKALSVK